MMTNSGPQRSAMGNCDAMIVETISSRLDDQLFRGPSGVFDQSKAATRAAISPARLPPALSVPVSADIQAVNALSRLSKYPTIATRPRRQTHEAKTWFPTSALLDPPLSVIGCLRYQP